MVYLGIHNSYQAGAALFVNASIKGAVSEERFTRVKDHHTFPFESISYLLKNEGLKLQDVDRIVYGMVTDVLPERSVLEKLIKRMVQGVAKTPTLANKFYERIASELAWNERHLDQLRKWSLDEGVSEKISFVDHHLSHAAGAYFTSPFKDAFVFTCDGKGNFKSSTIHKGEEQKLRELDFQTLFDSIGYYYGIITKALGFKAERHEGKITGLAAFGNYKNFNHITDSILSYQDGRIKLNIGDYYLPWFVERESLPKLYQEIDKHKIEDVAAAAQYTLEKTVCAWIKDSIFKYNSGKPSNVCLSGGVFANVKLNQKIREISEVKNIFIQPAMGDMGIPLGSVLAQLSTDGINPKKFQRSMALGPKATLTLDTIKKYKKNFDINEIGAFPFEIIDLIESNAVIGYVNGRSEFGPRALCNRSILYHCKDKTVNQWLNSRLNRTDFMPFAPVTTVELAKRCFIGWDETDRSSDFMTMTFKVTDEFLKCCPAAVHIDGTARPQIVRKETDPKMHSLLTSYYEKTGDLALINTSLNNHEEPIVCSFADAMKTLEASNIDILIVENYLIMPKKPVSV
jgi:carbamoyltransferase